eukprot:g4675.t1
MATEMAERKQFAPQPFLPREYEKPTEALPLIFPSPEPSKTRAGLQSDQSYAAREFVLQDLDVASGRRRGLPPSDAQLSVENLLEYILHADDFVEERPPTPPPPVEHKSALVELKEEIEVKEVPFELPDRALLLGQDYHRNVLAVAARLLEREPNAPFVTFTKWCATVLGQYPPGEKLTLRKQLSLQGLQALELSSCSLVAGDAFVVGQYIQLSGGRLWTVDLSCNDLQDDGAEYIANAIMTCLEGLPKCDIRVLNLSANGIGADDTVKKNAGGDKDTSSSKKKVIIKSLRDPNAGPAVNSGAMALGNLIRSNKTIHKLNLSKNHFGPVSTQEISRSLMTNKSLEELDYSMQNDPKHPGRGIGEEGAAAFAALLATGGNRVGLTKLDLSNNGLGPGGALAIEEALGGKRRRQTRLTAAVDASASVGLNKAAERRVKSLTTLILSYNRFGRRGGRSIGNILKANNSLTSLNVSYNGLGALDEHGRDGKGIARLAAGLGKNQFLRKLDLSGNQVSNCGALHLAKALKKRSGSQITLTLRNNEIEMVGAQELKQVVRENDNIDLVGNCLRPPTDSLRRPHPNTFYSRKYEENGRSKWVHADLKSAALGPRIGTSIGVLHKASVLVQRSDVRVPELFQAKSYERAGYNRHVGRRKRRYI